MTFHYPDVMNDVMDARQRYESGFVQHLAEVSPPAVPAGQVTELVLTLQNVLEAPIDVDVSLTLPRLRGRLRRLPQPLFQVQDIEFSIQLEQSEVKQLIIPIHVQPHVPAAEYAFEVAVHSTCEQEAPRIRAERAENRLGDLRIRYPQGLGITQIVSWGYVSQESDRQGLSLVVTKAGAPAKDVNLESRLESVWRIQDWEWIPPAQHEVNEQRLYIVPELDERLYIGFLRESQAVFAGSGVQLYLGEAITLAKILTYTVKYMASQTEWQDCLLVPIYAFAQANEQPLNDVHWLITQLGYMNVLELAVAQSFSLVEEMLGREMWSGAEQRALREFIVGCLEQGNTLPPEFLYLPLLLGGIVVARAVVIKGEDVKESLQLLSKAKAAKASLFSDPELRDLNETFDRLLSTQMRG
jgi:hypothetical protein